MPSNNTNNTSDKNACVSPGQFSFFTHRECEYFPCHAGIDTDNFNCLFCFCPLFALGKECGGDFIFTDKGVKNCKNCTIPHKRENYESIIAGCVKLCEKCRREMRGE
jgi:Zn-finger protein